MAVVNFYDDIFDTVSEVKEVDGGQLRDLLNEHIEKCPEKEMHEVYNAATDETEFIDLEITSYKAVVIINGQEGELDYSLKPDDIVSVIFIPQDSEAKRGWGMGLGVIGALVDIVGYALVATGVNAPVGALLLCIGTVVGAVGVGLYQSGLEQKTNEDAGRGNNLPYIDGASNQNQVGNRYLSVLGRHLISPNIVGSPYHETVTKDYEGQEDGGQWIKVLYCAGYGPLRLTNFKLGEQILAPNESNASGRRNTVMHGQLNTVDYYENKDGQKIYHPGDFTVKWKDNDVKMEILQAGDYVKNWNVSDINNDIYGTIYPQAVNEFKVDSNVLFAYDKALSELGKEVSVLYFNKAIPSGYRTNTVRLSGNCPEKLQVELDMPNGMYEMCQSDSNVYYKKIPIYVAVQWRYMKDSNEAADAESGAGWNSFDYMKFDNDLKIKPIKYTDTQRSFEINANKGLSDGTSRNYNEGWLDQDVFDIMSYSGSNSYWRNLNVDEIMEALKDGIFSSASVRPTSVQRANENNYPYVGEIVTELPKPSESYPYVVTPYEMTTFYKYELLDSKGGKYRLKDNVPQVWHTPDTQEYKKGEYNIKERRLVFEKIFSENEMKRIANYGTEETYYDQIEVRVIRMTPCYLPESQKTGKANGAEYQDLVNWTYLRTYKFDKQVLLDKLRNNEGFTREDIICRPQPIVTDLNDFVYIALSMKQDVNESVKTLSNSSPVLLNHSVRNMNQQQVNGHLFQNRLPNHIHTIINIKIIRVNGR